MSHLFLERSLAKGSMSINRNVTLIIPTANRVVFLERLLNYYLAIKYPGPIIVGDSSKFDDQVLAERISNKFSRSLDLKFMKFDSSASHPEKSVAMAHCISTPYAVIGADDDFVLGSGIENAANFLEISPDYDTAHGQMLIFSLDTAHGSVHTLNRYVTRSNEHSDPSVRLNQQFCEYYASNFYAVRRTSLLLRQLQAMWMVDYDRTLSTLSEPVAEGITVVSAKVKNLECPFAIRQYCAPLAQATRPPFVDWILAPDFSKKFEVFLKTLIFELDKSLRAQSRFLEYAVLSDFVKKAFSFYLARNIAEYAIGKDPFPVPSDCVVKSFQVTELIGNHSTWSEELSLILNIISKESKF